MATNFETLELVRTLVASGLPQAQAEAMAKAYARSLKSAVEAQVAAKSDVQALSGDIQSLSGELKTEIANLRAEMIAEVQSEVRGVLTWVMLGLAILGVIVILTRVIG